jgi:hypothetical protein
MRPKTSFGNPWIPLSSAKARPEITSPDVVGCLDNTKYKAPVPVITAKPLDPTLGDASPGPVYMVPGIFRHPTLPRPPSMLFGSTTRWRTVFSDSPGAGAFEPGSFGTRPPQWTIRTRSVDIDRSGLVPDPGTYDVFKRPTQKRGFTLVGRRKFADTKEATKRPGPGEYDVKHKFNSTVSNIPSLSFSMSRRFS